MILHLTHTDIRSDSRILKAMSAAERSGFPVAGIGFETPGSGVAGAETLNLQIITKPISCRRLRFLPRGIRHFLSMIEVMFRVVPMAVRIRPKILHSHDTTVLPVAVLVKLICGSRLIYDAHELESNRNGLSVLLGRLTRLAERALWGWVDLLIVVSPDIAEWYSANIGQKPSLVILNTPKFTTGDTTPRVYEDGYFRQIYGLSEDVTIYLYIGILGRGRGVDLILEVFRDPPQGAVVIFLGFGEYEAKIKYATRGAESRVFYHPPVPHQHVVDIARSADVGLCLIENISLSDYLALPNKLFEYAFSGLPVLASKFPAIEAVVSKYGLGECVELDVDAIREAVSHGKRRSERRRASDLRELSWDSQEIKLGGAYRSLWGR